MCHCQPSPGCPPGVVSNALCPPFGGWGLLALFLLTLIFTVALSARTPIRKWLHQHGFERGQAAVDPSWLVFLVVLGLTVLISTIVLREVLVV
jgi:hypothetical protein